MSVNWRDYLSVIAIALLFSTIIVSLTDSLGLDIQDWRLATIPTLLLGAIMFAIIGPQAVPVRGPVSGFVSRVGLVAVALGILSMAFNSQLLFILLDFVLVLLWSFMTTYHIRTQAT